MRTDALTLKQIRALTAVAREGSLSAAGAALGLTTPAIHAQIKGLEAACGTRVLRRSAANGRSELTEAGMVVRAAAVKIDDALSQIASDLGALEKGRAGRVLLGVVSTAQYYAPRLMKQLQDSCPGIDVVLRIGNREAIIAGLERGAFDLAIMGRPPRRPAVVADLLGPHPHGIIAAPDHPLAGESYIGRDALLAQTFLAREDGSGTRILMGRWLDRVAPGRAVETIVMDGNEPIKQAVMAGLGVAFVSLHTVVEELGAGRLIQFSAPGLPVVRHWFLVRPDVEAPRPVALRLAEAIRALNGSFLPRIAAPGLAAAMLAADPSAPAE
ncbi:LysR family regulator CbbR [Phaeovulum vinaykumarii]|uniref:HTH-type transcriptional regulator CbbR n=1 Tax=Phaeovulum vinaykumarii TaxID=407234 RepID=A0A1N7LI82_9RHOB|nr:LysR family transcriptional regulator [Phaeovulum vinaykumarii]SIS73494.1 DNA-binding transcriptional regulator, LysR family [Phaeovulum vinaykumarii]SOC04701.1 DNA-binding transcriptional LysR family regulator [Phaeovulum vinaykumarii]